MQPQLVLGHEHTPRFLHPLRPQSLSLNLPLRPSRALATSQRLVAWMLYTDMKAQRRERDELMVQRALQRASRGRLAGAVRAWAGHARRAATLEARLKEGERARQLERLTQQCADYQRQVGRTARPQALRFGRSNG